MTLVRTRSFGELSKPQQALVVVGGAVELAMTAAAAIDLVRRPREQVRGNKLMWAGVILIQPIGPIVYFLKARQPYTFSDEA